MKGTKYIALALGMLLMAGFLPVVSGENDSMNVIVTVEDRNYAVGDTITLDILIYQNGALTSLASAGDLTLAVSTHNNHNNAQNITVTSQGTGLYRGSYTVRQTDNHLYFFYEAALGNDHEAGELYIQVYSIQDNVDVSFCGQDVVPARPGDALTATILTRTGSTLIPVTGFTLLYVETPTGKTQNLTYVTRQDGIYDVEFTVPSVSVSGAYMITAQPIGMWQTDTAMVQVNVLDVWYHKVSVTGNTVSFEVFVSDMEGAPVQGASIELTREVWPQDTFNGVTNATGAALISVPNVEGRVPMTGFVHASGLNQSIQGTVFNPVPETPDHNDFDILFTGTGTLLEPGEEATLDYCAYDTQVPAASKKIDYYVTATGSDFDWLFGVRNHVEAAREVLAAGQATTDSLGKFSITFDVPEVQCRVDVRLEVPLDPAEFPPNEDHDLDDDKYYEAWPENDWNTEGFTFYAYEGNLDNDNEVKISGSFNPGKPGTMDASLSAATGDPVVAMWGIGEWALEDAYSESYDPEWDCWVPAGYLVGLTNTESGDYTGTFLVPEFIDGQDVTLVAGYMDAADGTPHFDAKTISPGGSLPWLWIIILIVIIVVVIAAAVLVKSRL